MNTDNFDYLRNQVKFTGFGDGLENLLKQKMESGQPAFTLTHEADYGGDHVSATLHFRRSDERDMYFFNKYDMALKKGDGGMELGRTFFIGKDNNITLKEGYNLLDGRSVNKDLVSKKGEKYNSWLKLDFNDADDKGNFKMKHFHENYGYDVQAALREHPIKELEDVTLRERLIESLKKGNRQAVTFLRDGEESSGFVQANPRFKSVTVTDGSGKEIRRGKRESETQDSPEEPGQTAKKKATRKKAVPKAGKEVKKETKKVTRKRGPRVS